MKIVVHFLVYQLNTKTFLALFCLPAVSSAFMIGNLPQAGLPAQSCRLVMSGPKKVQSDGSTLTQQYFCSGTIIGRSQVLSAAHCFSGKDIVGGTISCPGDTDKKITTWKISKNFAENEDGTISSTNVKWDLALVRVDGVFKATPARLHKTMDGLKTFLDGKQNQLVTGCTVSGYGLNEVDQSGDHNGRKVTFSKALTSVITHSETHPVTGVKKEVRKENVFEWYSDNIALQVVAEEKTTAGELIGAIRSGDSGGGLICQVEGDSPMVLGVISGTGKATVETGEHFAGSLSPVALDNSGVESLFSPEEGLVSHVSFPTLSSVH